MFWVNQIANKIIKSRKHKPYWLDDMKTPSGRIHVGSLRGVLIHDFVYKALLKKGKKAKYTYIYNDTDPMDGLPTYLDKKTYLPHMGRPLYKIPVPNSKKSFAQVYADEFTKAMQIIGAKPEIIWSSKLYKSGKMDKVIKISLDNADKIQRIYHKTAGYKKKANWFPFQVNCEKCGKVSTTTVYKWDGKYVYYKCEKNKVKWAKGCEFKSKISPYGGTGKLLWKVDWPAHWKALGITIEGAGKDHSSSGGSRDIAAKILKKIFNYPNPFDIPYEWILVKGAKMSSSKGIGTSAYDFVKELPPNLCRFLFARTHYNKVINFDPVGNTISDLFDEYDRCAEHYFKGKNDDFAKMFEISQLNKIPEKESYTPRFRDVAGYIQMPHINIKKHFESKKKSKLTSFEEKTLNERIYYAKIWLNKYAPQEKVFNITKTLPKSIESLSEKQIIYLRKVIELLKLSWKKPEDLQQELYEESKKLNIKTNKAFKAIYISLLDKSYGPKAAWLLLSNKDEVMKRLEEILGTDIKGEQEKYIYPILSNHKLLSIDNKVLKKYPSVILGFAVIKGVKIKKKDARMEKEKKIALDKYVDIDLNNSPEVLSYRKMYKDMGIDWHSRRPSPEALMRRIIKGKGLYRINTAVDACNLIVMKHLVSHGVFDYNKVKFPTALKTAEGGEKILLLGDKKETILTKGEVCYFDRESPYNLDFNYRDIQRTCVTEKTTNILINTDGVYNIGRKKLETALRDCVKEVIKYCGGSVEIIGIVKA